MEQHNLNFAPLQYGWSSFDLDGYRSSRGTYDLFAYEDLPPIPATQLQGKFQWLTPLEKDLDQQMQIYSPSVEERAQSQEKLKNITTSAQHLGLTLPDEFLHFMSSPELQNRIPSCTACYFELPEKIVPFPGAEEGYIIRFMNDQQCVLLWYLYLTRSGKQSILVSHYWLDDLKPLHELTQEELTNIHEHTFICAPSFEAFLYRFWLENTIWFNLTDDKPLTEEQQRYVKHYKNEFTDQTT
jgi:hypothetical protein